MKYLIKATHPEGYSSVECVKDTYTAAREYAAMLKESGLVVQITTESEIDLQDGVPWL